MNEGLLRFESVGTNCEFGFFLQANEIENGSLFNWTFIQDYKKLIELIKDDFPDLYSFENLYPTFRDMVTDKKYLIAFHTKMYSSEKDGIWVYNFDEAKNREIYEIEIKKIKYLIQKFKASLRDKNRIFVLKKQEKPMLHVAVKLAELLREYGNAQLLYVEDSDDVSKQGKVFHVSNNLFSGYVDRFAYHINACDISSMWGDVTQNMLLKLT